MKHLVGDNLLNHPADLNLHFAFFLLADGHAVGVRNFFRDLASNLAGTRAGFRSADRDAVGVRNFFRNLASHLDSARAVFRSADRDAVGERNFFRNLTSHFAGARAGFRLADRHTIGVGNFLGNLTSTLDDSSSFFLMIYAHGVGVRLFDHLSFAAGVLDFPLNDIGNPDAARAGLAAAAGCFDAAVATGVVPAVHWYG